MDASLVSLMPATSGRARTRLRLGCVVVLAGFVSIATLGGCDTLGSDVGNIFQDIAPPSPRQAAEWALDPHDAENRRRGTTLLANAPWGGSDVYTTMYRDRVANELDPQVLAISIRALARWGVVDDAIPIAAHLEHPSREVRWEAARGLQRLHNPAVVAELTRRLADQNEDQGVRLESAIALGQYPQDRVFQALVAALDARELGINLEAQQSLVLLTGEDFGFDRVAWIRWYDATAEPFANQDTFYFPTFTRRVRLGDRLAFWRPLVFESPAPPAGLRDDGARSTYEDFDVDDDAPRTSSGSNGGAAADGRRSTYDDPAD